MLKISLDYNRFSQFFFGFERELELATNCGELIVWKGGVARNVGLMLHSQPYQSIQKDLDLDTDALCMMSIIGDVKSLRWGGSRVDWESKLMDDLSINNCLVVQLGRKLLWVGGNSYSPTHIEPLYEWGESWYYVNKKEWRCLIFAWRYSKQMSFHFDLKGLELIRWMEKTGIEKIPALERPDFKSWVNVLAGRAVFPNVETCLPTKEEREANHWFPKEGY